MDNIEQLIEIHACIRNLEKRQASETDPRVRADIAQTLDMLESSLDLIVSKLGNEKQPA